MKIKVALMGLVASLSLSSVAVAADTEAMMQAAGKDIFTKCSACHSLDASKNAFGPSLIGVVGREAASLPRFAYSDALRNSGITWTEDNLRKWIAGNDQFVPGTRMRHVEITDKAEQDYLIAYLKTL
ncbi:c-type cytochrome [Neptuniibacter marinus]|uniref:c-type cytochrome n=1 Tax=Neptuniibacter marinus TaxID=1806670 RepID=UPI00083286FD|nr:c-type cytochrome [Neptuniibacter marinus]